MPDWILVPRQFTRSQVPPPTAPQFGVNGHATRHTGTYRNISDDQEFSTLAANGLKRYRTDVPLAADTDPWVVPRMQAVLAVAQTYGIKIEPVLQLPLMFGDKTDNGQYPAGDAAALYAQGYNRTFNFVTQFATQIHEWEFGNEINLIPRDGNGQPLYGQGWTAAEYAAYPSMVEFANLLRGMSDAIDQININQGQHLRRIVGTTSTMFGYIDFMRASGVKIDVLGYHYYEHVGVDPTNYWGGVRPTFNLFSKFASYGIPACVNELNGAEIFDAGFDNTAGSATMATCNSNLGTMLATFGGQRAVEWIDVYELIDETEYAAPENRFGVMFTLASPKPLLATLAAAAGAPSPPPPPPPSVTFPGGLNVITNHVPMTLAPTVTGPTTGLGCSGVMLPTGLSIDASTCVISGTPNYGSTPTYVTASINVSSTGQVDIVSFQIQ